MSLTTKPPAADARVRPDAAPAGAARGTAAQSAAPDEGAALRLLIEELIVALASDLKLKAPAPDAASLPRDPRTAATVLLAWLRGATEASGAPAGRLATLIERAYARVLEILARLPAGSDAAEANVRGVRNALLAELGAGIPSPLRTHAAGAMPLKVLVAELERAVLEELGPVPGAPRQAAGEDAGNVAAALLRWLRAAAGAADVPLGRLRGAADRALERTRAILTDDAAVPAALEELDKASEVLIAAIGRAPRGDATPAVPTFRPDLPVMPLALGSRARRDPTGARRAPPEREGGEAEEPVDGSDEPAEAPAAPDLKGPMQLIRRYFEDFQSGEPGACARHFVYPACRWQGGRWQAYADTPALNAAYAATHKERLSGGEGPGTILMLRVEPVGPTIATVRALVSRNARPGDPAGEVEVAYTTVLTAAGWRIAVLMLA